MKEFLSSGVVGNIEYNAQKQIREDIQTVGTSLDLQKVFQKL